MWVLAELDFAQTVAAGAINVLLTAFFVVIIAGLVVGRFQDHADKARATEDRRYLDERARVAELNEKYRQANQLEHQTRTALRETYAQLLVAQRRSRQASMALAVAGGWSRDNPEKNRDLERAATKAHDEFIDQYHRLNLDVSKEMWEDARGLRHVLDRMLKAGRANDEGECNRLAKVARHARQNLERSFRRRLGLEPLQPREDLGEFDKGQSNEEGDEDGEGE